MTALREVPSIKHSGAALVAVLHMMDEGSGPLPPPLNPACRRYASRAGVGKASWAGPVSAAAAAGSGGPGERGTASGGRPSFSRDGDSWGSRSRSWGWGVRRDSEETCDAMSSDSEEDGAEGRPSLGAFCQGVCGTAAWHGQPQVGEKGAQPLLGVGKPSPVLLPSASTPGCPHPTQPAARQRLGSIGLGPQLWQLPLPGSCRRPLVLSSQVQAWATSTESHQEHHAEPASAPALLNPGKCAALTHSPEGGQAGQPVLLQRAQAQRRSSLHYLMSRPTQQGPGPSGLPLCYDGIHPSMAVAAGIADGQATDMPLNLGWASAPATAARGYGCSSPPGTAGWPAALVAASVADAAGIKKPDSSSHAGNVSSAGVCIQEAWQGPQSAPPTSEPLAMGNPTLASRSAPIPTHTAAAAAAAASFGTQEEATFWGCSLEAAQQLGGRTSVASLWDVDACMAPPSPLRRPCSLMQDVEVHGLMAMGAGHPQQAAELLIPGAISAFATRAHAAAGAVQESAALGMEAPAATAAAVHGGAAGASRALHPGAWSAFNQPAVHATGGEYGAPPPSCIRGHVEPDFTFAVSVDAVSSCRSPGLTAFMGGEAGRAACLLKVGSSSTSSFEPAGGSTNSASLPSRLVQYMALGHPDPPQCLVISANDALPLGPPTAAVPAARYGAGFFSSSQAQPSLLQPASSGSRRRSSQQDADPFAWGVLEALPELALAEAPCISFRPHQYHK